MTGIRGQWFHTGKLQILTPLDKWKGSFCEGMQKCYFHIVKLFHQISRLFSCDKLKHVISFVTHHQTVSTGKGRVSALGRLLETQQRTLLRSEQSWRVAHCADFSIPSSCRDITDEPAGTASCCEEWPAYYTRPEVLSPASWIRPPASSSQLKL